MRSISLFAAFHPFFSAQEMISQVKSEAMSDALRAALEQHTVEFSEIQLEVLCGMLRWPLTDARLLSAEAHRRGRCVIGR